MGLNHIPRHQRRRVTTAVQHDVDGPVDTNRRHRLLHVSPEPVALELQAPTKAHQRILMRPDDGVEIREPGEHNFAAAAEPRERMRHHATNSDPEIGGEILAIHQHGPAGERDAALDDIGGRIMGDHAQPFGKLAELEANVVRVRGGMRPGRDEYGDRLEGHAGGHQPGHDRGDNRRRPRRSCDVVDGNDGSAP